ncbi:MAG: methionine synthase, partial [Microcoleus sp. SIO2G3]|nr:methionine synthase [Microcoleus sp. SIO2G3]
VLKHIPHRFNIVRRPGGAPGNWAGSKHFQVQGNQLIDPNVNQTLQYLHWAGIRLEPGCPYWNIWKYYRYLNEPLPDDNSFQQTPKSFWDLLVDKVKRFG